MKVGSIMAIAAAAGLIAGLGCGGAKSDASAAEGAAAEGEKHKCKANGHCGADKHGDESPAADTAAPATDTAALATSAAPATSAPAP